jgi:hypothetical protein
MSSATASLTPVTRATLRGLKAQKDEEKRQETIGQIVLNLYRSVHTYASTTTHTSYAHPFPKGASSPVCWGGVKTGVRVKKTVGGTPVGDNDPFFMENIEHIIEQLQPLFPDCTIRYTSLVTAQNGKKYDTSTLDEAMLSLINQDSEHLHLIVDWS